MTKQRKREQLLDVAVEVLNTNGIKKTTLDDIATAAGIAAPSLYYYFKNKNEMLKGVVSKVIGTVVENLEADIAACSGHEEKLKSIPKSLHNSIKGAQFIATIDLNVKSEMVILAQDLIDNLNESLAKGIFEILDDGCKKGLFAMNNIPSSAGIMAHTIWNLLEKDLATPNFDTSVDRVNALLDLFLNGLKTR